MTRPLRLLPPWLLGLALAAPFAFASISGADTGWHIVVGRAVSRSGIPHRNLLSWTFPDAPWYASSWLYDWACAALEQRLGLLGLQLLTAALLAAALLGLAFACAEEDAEAGPWLVPAFAALLLPRIMPRPHVASWAALAWVVAICLRGRERGPRFRLACLLLVAVSGNIHPGAVFAAGVVGLFCAEAFVRARTARERWIEAGVAAGAVLALCANPGGVYNLIFLVRHLTVNSLIPIQEFGPAAPVEQAAILVLLPLGALSAWPDRRARPALLACVLVFGGLALHAGRMAFEFELVAAPALARGLGLLRARWGSRASWAAAAAVVVLACGARRVDGWLRALQPAAALDPSALPVRAAGFIRAHGLTGRHFNSFDDGGALEYLLPELPAYADSRIHAYPDAFYRRELAAERSPESFRAFLRAQGIEWAITLRSPTVFTGDKLLDGASDWALVYWDDLNEIFLRRDVPRFAPLIAALEYRHFRPDGAVFAEVARAPRAGLRAIDDELARFGERNPDDPYLALMRCEIAVRRGEPPEGPACAEAWSRAGSSERLRGLVALARQVPPLP